MSAAVAGQAPSPLGDDPAQFDQLFDSAFLRRDVAFIEAAAADDVVFAVVPALDAPVWNKRLLIDGVRVFDGCERTSTSSPSRHMATSSRPADTFR